mgnify:CR=1 FL=1
MCTFDDRLQVRHLHATESPGTSGRGSSPCTRRRASRPTSGSCAIVSARTTHRRAGRTRRPPAGTTAISPARTAIATIAGRIFGRGRRPIVAQHRRPAPLPTRRAHAAPSARCDERSTATARRTPDTGTPARSPSEDRRQPALKRKNFTPASLDTNTSVNAIPTPRCARKKNRTVERTCALVR